MEEITIYENIGGAAYRVSDANGIYEFSKWQECSSFCIGKYNGRKISISGITSIDRCEELREKIRELEQRAADSCKALTRVSCTGCPNNC